MLVCTFDSISILINPSYCFTGKKSETLEIAKHRTNPNFYEEYPLLAVWKNHQASCYNKFFTNVILPAVRNQAIVNAVVTPRFLISPRPLSTAQMNYSTLMYMNRNAQIREPPTLWVNDLSVDELSYVMVY